MCQRYLLKSLGQCISYEPLRGHKLLDKGMDLHHFRHVSTEFDSSQMNESTYPKICSHVRRYECFDIAVQDVLLVKPAPHQPKSSWEAFAHREHSRLLHRIEHSLRVDLHLQPRDDAQKP